MGMGWRGVGRGGGGWAFTWYITLYTILVQKWGVGAYMVMGAYKVLYSICQFHLYILRVPDQNGVSRLYNMLEIYHSGLEPLISNTCVPP